MSFLEPIWDTFLVHPLMRLALIAYSALTQLGCGLGGSGSNCSGLTYEQAQSLLGPVANFLSNPIQPGGTLDVTAHWLPWVTNGLSKPDHTFILPVLAGAAQLVASVMAM